MRISDWSSDVCSSDLGRGCGGSGVGGYLPRRAGARPRLRRGQRLRYRHERGDERRRRLHRTAGHGRGPRLPPRRTRRPAGAGRSRLHAAVRRPARGAGTVKPHLAMVAVLVRDYDEAIAWYRDALGFVLLEDTDRGGGKRWVRMAPAGNAAFSLLLARAATPARSEEHTSELQSLMRISYAVFCLKKKKIKQSQH